MSIFSRRRIQLMLSNVVASIGYEKAYDILKRLEDKRVTQSLPAEMELALIWALAENTEVEVEPAWWPGTRRPDVFCENLLERPSVIEIASPNNASLSDEDEMDKISQQFCALANKLKKGFGDRLYFNFKEESGYNNGVYYRNRKIVYEYKIDEYIKDKFSLWILDGCASGKINIQQDGLDVVIEIKENKQLRYQNFHCTMPTLALSADRNPLSMLLERKTKQISNNINDILKIIFIADAGSSLIKNIGRFGEIDMTGRSVSGSQIIQEFVSRNSHRLDAVVTFAPRRQGFGFQDRGPMHWSVTVFSESISDTIEKSLRPVVEILPRPRFEGYQARSLYRQNAFAPESKGWYLGMVVTGDALGVNSIKMSSRLLMDFLAGRISKAEFEGRLDNRDGRGTFFADMLNEGYTISKVEMAPRDIDEDDDYLIVSFSIDPAASKLRLGS